jgi:hypothetical protein
VKKQITESRKDAEAGRVRHAREFLAEIKGERKGKKAATRKRA